MNCLPPCGIECSRGCCFLVGNYPVYYGKQVVGKVQICLQGLYYQITGRCQLSTDVVRCLVMQCDSKRENLGVLVPGKHGLSIDRKIPVKYFSAANPEFCIVPHHESMEGRFVPIYPEEPFRYLSCLQEAYLVVRNGQAGVILHEKT